MGWKMGDDRSHVDCDRALFSDLRPELNVYVKTFAKVVEFTEQRLLVRSRAGERDDDEFQQKFAFDWNLHGGFHGICSLGCVPGKHRATGKSAQHECLGNPRICGTDFYAGNPDGPEIPQEKELNRSSTISISKGVPRSGYLVGLK